MLLLKKYSVNPLLNKISFCRILKFTAVNHIVNIIRKVIRNEHYSGNPYRKYAEIYFQNLTHSDTRLYTETNSFKIL